MKRRTIWLAAAALALIVVLGGRLLAGEPSGQLSAAATAALAADGMTPLGGARAPDFHLVDQNGHPVSLSDFRGKAVILAFLDPVCWLECPFDAQEMAGVDRLLGPALSKRLQLVAIDANPDYLGIASLQHFDARENLDRLPNWTYATSPSLHTIQAVWKAYGVAVSVPAHGMVDHSIVYYLIGPQGREQFLSTPTTNTNLFWGTSQLLAVYIKRMLGATGPLVAAAPQRLPKDAPAVAIGPPGPVAVHFASARQGWLVANSPPYQLLYATDDGGATWRDVGPSGVTQRGGLAWSWPAPGVAWAMVRPYGWMLDATVYRTTTDGASWGTPRVMSGAPPTGAPAPLAARSASQAGALVSGGLWTTADGGATWRKATPLPAGAAPTGLAWSPDGSAWVSGAGARLLRLPASGSAWQPISLPTPAKFAGTGIATLPPAWQPGGQGGVALTAHGWLWYDVTADGGTTWKPALPPIQVSATGPDAVEVAGGGVYVLRQAGSGTAVWRGDPATGTWTQIGSPLPATGAAAVDFLDPTRGWVVAAAGPKASALWRTQDGGRTWQRAPLPVPAKGA